MWPRCRRHRRPRGCGRTGTCAWPGRPGCRRHHASRPRSGRAQGRGVPLLGPRRSVQVHVDDRRDREGPGPRRQRGGRLRERQLHQVLGPHHVFGAEASMASWVSILTRAFGSAVSASASRRSLLAAARSPSRARASPLIASSASLGWAGRSKRKAGIAGRDRLLVRVVLQLCASGLRVRRDGARCVSGSGQVPGAFGRRARPAVQCRARAAGGIVLARSASARRGRSRRPGREPVASPPGPAEPAMRR